MKASELRIGNLVDLGNRIAKIIEIAHLACVVVDLEETQDTIEDYERVKGIPLNEDWLLKFGFEWCNEAVGYFDKDHAAYFMYPNVQFHPFCTNDKDCWIELQYVHQLQNLCFVLTGKELEIKA
jgi:hypothetical protein